MYFWFGLLLWILWLLQYRVTDCSRSFRVSWSKLMRCFRKPPRATPCIVVSDYCSNISISNISTNSSYNNIYHGWSWDFYFIFTSRSLYTGRVNNPWNILLICYGCTRGWDLEWFFPPSTISDVNGWSGGDSIAMVVSLVKMTFKIWTLKQLTKHVVFHGSSC